MTSIASAPGKLIICGEHAVVYGQPAIAVPLPDVRAWATVAQAASPGIVCAAPDLGETWRLSSQRDHPLAQLTISTLRRLGLAEDIALHITLRSNIPIASGMGSGAALGAALVKALAAYAGHVLSSAEVAALVYESERAFHGTPSGIDNTVVSYEQPVWFRRGAQDTPPTIEQVQIAAPLHLVIGDTGVRAPTSLTVGVVRERWQREPDLLIAYFEQIGSIVQQVRAALAAGQLTQTGELLNQNQAVLHRLGVSSPDLERLISAAIQAGALGAKLSGGGGGGVMLALTTAERIDHVRAALQHAGAAHVLATSIVT